MFFYLFYTWNLELSAAGTVVTTYPELPSSVCFSALSIYEKKNNNNISSVSSNSLLVFVMFDLEQTGLVWCCTTCFLHNNIFICMNICRRSTEDDLIMCCTNKWWTLTWSEESCAEEASLCCDVFCSQMSAECVAVFGLPPGSIGCCLVPAVSHLNAGLCLPVAPRTSFSSACFTQRHMLQRGLTWLTVVITPYRHIYCLWVLHTSHL